MNTGIRTLSHRRLATRDILPRIKDSPVVKRSEFRSFKDRAFKRIEERKNLVGMASSIEKDKEGLAVKREGEARESAWAVGTAAFCALAAFAMNSPAIGVLFAAGAALAATYGTITYLMDSMVIKNAEGLLSEIKTQKRWL